MELRKIINSTNIINTRWYALYTKSRHEKFIESALIKKGIEAFTPKVLFKKRWSDRTKLIEEPLFKSYCFARFSFKNKIDVVSQSGVVNVVNFKGKYISVQDTVIDSLRVLMKNGVRFDPYPYLNIGAKVEIKNGPFKGVEGYILEKRNKNTVLVVSIEAIASSVKCIVDIDCVDPA